MKIHCGQLVEGALRSALAKGHEQTSVSASPSGSLLDRFTPSEGVAAGKKIVFLEPSSPASGS
jgi:hypothetical protein